ncbi:MAG: M23 family metallopeptidase [Myxococcota bacterium]
MAVLVLILTITVPRAIAYGRLYDSHAELQDRLRSLERDMNEVDRILMRLRLYDAQLESLGGANGSSGPYAELEVRELQRLPEGSPLDGRAGPRIRPVTDWAGGLTARVETFLRLFETAEPGLTVLVEELEGLSALDRALPSFWPAAGTLTSGFGWRRHPLGLRWRHHGGIDLDGQIGDPVWAASEGTVTRIDEVPTYGRLVELDHGFGVTTLYAHANEILVKVGQRVERGQPIALVGNTGRSTGPHLHFEVRLEGHAVDPLDYLPLRTGWTPAWHATPRD